MDGRGQVLASVDSGLLFFDDKRCRQSVGIVSACGELPIDFNTGGARPYLERP